MDDIFVWFKSVWEGFVDFLYRLLLTVFDFAKDFLWWILDSLFSAIVLVLDSVSLSLNKFSPLTYIDGIPESTKYFMVAVGFNECMGMLVAAISIRILLRMIPFIRLGG